MNQKTEEEIKSAIALIWDRDEPDKVEITIKPNEVRIRMTSMFDPPGLNFEKLTRLSQFFGTMNIDDAERISDGGCETCDYGSCYGFELVIGP